MPSLNPNRFRGVSCVVDVDDVRPNPSCDHFTATVPVPSRARLRTACTATCGSLAHAWMAMSPPLRVGSRISPGKCCRSTSAAGFCAPSPNRSNSVGPKPMVMVSWLGASPNASPVSFGGAYCAPPTAASR